MAEELIANENFELKATSLGGWIPGDPNAPSDMTVAPLLAGKVKADNKYILINQINWIVIPTRCTFAGHTHVNGSSIPLPPPGFNNAEAIKATAEKCKADLLPVMRKGDTGKCNGMFTNNSSGASVPCQCIFELSNAGQEKVKGK